MQLFLARTEPLPADWTEGVDSLCFGGIDYSTEIAGELKEPEDAVTARVRKVPDAAIRHR